MKEHSTACAKRRAFSLVELSIVLVILGLLVGGVLAGRSLIRASELRAITTEKDRYTTAIFTFRDKYFQLPGDLNNAFQFWGATCGTDTTAISTGCNGDGDGMLERFAVGENVKAWEHMARAGIIEGSYDGAGTNPFPMIPGNNYVYLSSTNSPASKFPKLSWDVSNEWVGISGIVPASGFGGILLKVGSINMTSVGYPIGLGSSMTRTEAWNIDTKTDDGAANTGKVRGTFFASSCNDSGTDYYRVSAGADIADCALAFILQ